MAQVGRPHALDQVKRREICALVAAGCSLEWAAHYVGCSSRTIRREALRNEDFDEELRRAELSAQLNPLKALQNASSTHWRAAAWLLERTCPERFAKPDPIRLDREEVNDIIAALFEEINQAIPDPHLCLQVYQRLTGFFQSRLNEAWAARSARRDPRRARKMLDNFATFDDSTLDNIPHDNPDDFNDSSPDTFLDASQNPPNTTPPRT